MKSTIANGASGATVRAALNAMFDELYGTWASFVAGRWYGTVQAGIYAAGSASAANSIKLYPFFLRDGATISDLAAHVTTLAAAGNFSLAIYANDPATMRPTGNALAATGSISTAATGEISADITGSDVTLAPGLYWAAMNKDNGTAVFKIPALTSAFPGWLLGSATLATATNGSTSTITHISTPQAYGTWPDLTSATFTEAGGSSQFGALWFKVSAIP